MSKNDIAWEQIFYAHKILGKVTANGHAFIDAKDINKFREARLMTKFDHRSQLPHLFADNNLSILPVSRGGYVIGDFNTFHNFEDSTTGIIKVSAPTFLESLDFSTITSEATAINCAFVSRILNDFTGEEDLYPTINGRMSSSIFNFDISAKLGLFKVNVSNSQVEIDGGFEGSNSLNIIEAKNYISDDFLIRQLYYPYKLWVGKVRKVVRPIFLTYSNGVFHLREYAFDDPTHYNSVRLVKEGKYSIQHTVINIQMVQEILSSVKTVPEPQIPFPQADSFKRIINLAELVKEKGTLTKEEITTNYDFTSRQTDYYSNALAYLGLLTTIRDNGQVAVTLTETGQNLFNLSIDSRQLEFIKSILSHSAFQKTLQQYFASGIIPTPDEIVAIMKKANLYRVNEESTFYRRASTITGWINWIISVIEE
ncbi:type II restriction enzyme [Flavobacterium sp.]|uniref:type II restriction enzyme n=1 Tax=Flavobacterium sp. TaxID=239 RepID=UPI003752DB22